MYTGVAKDVLARIAQHDAGKGAKYTRGRGPLKVCATAECDEQGDALRLERKIKALPREEKMKLAKLGRLDVAFGLGSFVSLVSFASLALAGAAMFLCTACDTPAPPAAATDDGKADAAAQAARIAAYLARDAAAATDAATASRTVVTCTPGTDVDFRGDQALETEVRRKVGKDAGAISETDLHKVRSLNLAQAHEGQLDPCIYPKFTSLRDLFLGAGEVDDLSPIANLLELRTLTVANTKVSDLKPLTKQGLMDRLDISHTAVHDLTDVAHMTTLTELNIDGTLITDLAPLVSVPNLQKVSMMLTGVTDLSPLKNQRKLRFLYIFGSSVHDLTPLDPLVAHGLKIINTQ